MYNILICDDEPDIVKALKIYLDNPDIKLYEAFTGKEALEVMKEADIQLILLDIMMPEMDGISAMAKIRETSNVPIILVTAKSEDTDIILGLNTGADDYITKPFRPMEVMARIRSQLRRYVQLGGKPQKENSFIIGGIELDDVQKQLTVDGNPVSLTPKEFDILKLLMSHPGEVFSPNQIYRQVWGADPFASENTVAVHVRHLREKIEIDPKNPRFLKVVWGQGYQMERAVNDEKINH